MSRDSRRFGEEIVKLIDRVRAIARTIQHAITPSETAWHGAAIGVYLLGTVAIGLLFTLYFLQDFAWQKLPAYFVWVGLSILIGLATLLVAALVMRIPI